MNDMSSIPAPAALSEQEGIERLRRIQVDPTRALALEKLREEVFGMLTTLVRDVAADLPQSEEAPAGIATAGPMSFQELKNYSRQKESAGKQRQEAAQALVMGALLNRHNAEWDPMDPATDRASTENLICALLQAPPPAAE